MMKKCALYLSIIVSGLFLVLTIVSCGDDKEEIKPQQQEKEMTDEDKLVGKWVEKFEGGGYQEYVFQPSGNGSHRDGGGNNGILEWKITSPGNIHIKFWYLHNENNTEDWSYRVYKEEVDWDYELKNGILYLDGGKYVRESVHY